MTMRDKIDGVLIDPDENGFHLILSGEERDYNFTLDQEAATALHAAVATEITPWLLEMNTARRAIRASAGPITPQGREVAKEVWTGKSAEEAIGLGPMTAPRGGIEYEDAPYDQDDPKHPDYHDTMSGIWDNRADK